MTIQQLYKNVVIGWSVIWIWSCISKIYISFFLLDEKERHLIDSFRLSFNLQCCEDERQTRAPIDMLEPSRLTNRSSNNSNPTNQQTDKRNHRESKLPKSLTFWVQGNRLVGQPVIVTLPESLVESRVVAWAFNLNHLATNSHNAVLKYWVFLFLYWLWR